VLEQAVVTKAARTMRNSESWSIRPIVSGVEIGAANPFIEGKPWISFSPSFDLEGRCCAAPLDSSWWW
jgi:hypothetical protein